MVTCSVVYAVSSWYAVCGLQAQIDLEIVSASACRLCRMLLHWMLAAQLVRARLDGPGDVWIVALSLGLALRAILIGCCRMDIASRCVLDSGDSNSQLHGRSGAVHDRHQHRHRRAVVPEPGPAIISKHGTLNVQRSGDADWGRVRTEAIEPFGLVETTLGIAGQWNAGVAPNRPRDSARSRLRRIVSTLALAYPVRLAFFRVMAVLDWDT